MTLSREEVKALLEASAGFSMDQRPGLELFAAAPQLARQLLATMEELERFQDALASIPTVEVAAQELHRIEVELVAEDAGDLTEAEWQELWEETAEQIKQGWRKSARRVLSVGRNEPLTCKDGRERGESIIALVDRLEGP